MFQKSIEYQVDVRMSCYATVYKVNSSVKLCTLFKDNHKFRFNIGDLEMDTVTSTPIPFNIRM